MDDANRTDTMGRGKFKKLFECRQNITLVRELNIQNKFGLNYP